MIFFCGKIAFLVHETSDPNSKVDSDVKEGEIRAYIEKLILSSERDSGRKIDLSCYSFNRYSRLKDFKGFELSEFDFSNSGIRSIDFTNSNLNDSDFIAANLTDAILLNADLNGSDLTDATLKNTDLKCANLIGVEIDSSQLLEAKNVELAYWSPDQRESLIEREIISDTEVNLEEICDAVTE